MTSLQAQPDGISPNGSRFWLTAYALFVLLAGTNLPTPLYRGYQAEFGFSTLMVTVVFAAYIGALIPALLITGSLSDAIGRRKVLVPALLIAAIASFVFAAANGLGWLLAARVLQGAAIGAASGALTATLSELEPKGDRGRAALVVTTFSLGGLGAGPIVAAVLAEYLPAPHVTPFALEILLLLPAIAAMATLPEKAAVTAWRPRYAWIPPAMRRPFIISGLANFLAFSVIGLFLCLAPTYVANLLASNSLLVASGAVSLMLAASITSQIMLRAMPSITLQTRGMMLLALGVALLALAGRASSLALMWTASVVGGAGHGMVFLGGTREVNRLAPAERHADVLSTFYVLVYLGVGVPVIGVGFLANFVGVVAAVQLFALLVVPLCLLDLLLMLKLNNRDSGAPISPR